MYVYLLTNPSNTVLYVGVTNDLARRVYEHKYKLVPGFTQRYNVHRLVYFEFAEEPMVAIAREKQLKGGSRQDKINLIEQNNPDWRDLYEEIASS